jgi:hypothetical protein
VHAATTRTTATESVAEYRPDIQSGASGPRFSLSGSLSDPAGTHSAMVLRPGARLWFIPHSLQGRHALLSYFGLL